MASLTPNWPCFCTSISVRGSFPNSRNSGVIIPLKASSSTESPTPTSSDSPEISRESEPTKIDPVKIAFAKARAYKKGVQLQQPNTSSQAEDVIKVKPRDSENETIQNTETMTDNESTRVDFENATASRKEPELPASVKLAMERAKKYKANKENKESVLPVGSSNEDREVVETEEIIIKKINEKGELKVSKMDFIGLGFSDKRKTRGLPAGLVPMSDPFPDRDPGQVEIIVGDKTKFGNATVSEPVSSNEDDDKPDMYKPKVSTWGVFPRPGNISKTYGGGRTIRPGESLETDEDKAAREARTKELLSQYKKQTGIKVDPELRDECEKDMRNGDALMENGKLDDALPFYEKIMEKMAFQNELHGLAALQWSICQDSLGRQSKARVMYEKLQSHPTYSVSKSAKQFLFGFQAMDMMKVRSMDMSKVNEGYQNYFEAFIKDKENDYSIKITETDDNVGLGLDQVLPYFAFIVSPIFLVLLIALTKAR